MAPVVARDGPRSAVGQPPVATDAGRALALPSTTSQSGQGTGAPSGLHDWHLAFDMKTTSLQSDGPAATTGHTKLQMFAGGPRSEPQWRRADDGDGGVGAGDGDGGDGGVGACDAEGDGDAAARTRRARATTAARRAMPRTTAATAGCGNDRAKGGDVDQPGRWVDCAATAGQHGVKTIALCYGFDTLNLR